MNLDKFIQMDNIPETIDYTKGGNTEKLYPRTEISIDERGEPEQLSEIPGLLYMYAWIAGELTKSLTTIKNQIKHRRSSVFLTEKTTGLQKGQKIPEKTLEHMCTLDTKVTEMSQIQVDIESAKSTVDAIILALINKREALLEMSRRKKLELR
jgi:hypothetical protein